MLMPRTPPALSKRRQRFDSTQGGPSHRLSSHAKHTSFGSCNVAAMITVASAALSVDHESKASAINQSTH